MARDKSKNLALTVNVEYDVFNFRKLPENVQLMYDQVLDSYGKKVIENVANFVGPDGPGPGPHPHRSELTPPDHNFKWTDTGKLADAVHYRVISRGYLRTVEIFVDPIEVDGRLVDYGTFLEVGWHPLIPIKGGGVRPSGKFYAYPWLSTTLARSNSGVMKEVMRAWKSITAPLQGNIHVFAKGRSKSGKGVRMNKFVVSENITADVKTFQSDKIMKGWLEEIPGINVTGNRFFPEYR